MRGGSLIAFLLIAVFTGAYVIIDVGYGPEIDLSYPASPVVLWKVGGRAYWDLMRAMEAGIDLGLSIDLETLDPIPYGGFSLRVIPLDSVPIFISLGALVDYPLSYAFSAELGVDLRLNELVSIKLGGYFETDFKGFDYGFKLNLISSSYSRKPGCRDIPPGTIRLKEVSGGVELICMGAFGGSMVVSEEWIREVLEGIKVELGKTVEMAGKAGVKLEALRVRYLGKELFLEDGRAPRAARPSDPYVRVEIRGSTFQVVDHSNVFEDLVSQDVKFRAYRMVYGAERVHLLGKGGKLEGYGCGGMDECEVEGIDRDEGILVCGGMKIPAEFERVDLEVKEELKEWIRGDEAVELEVGGIFEEPLEIPLDITVNGVPLESFKASESGILNVVLKPSTGSNLCVVSPEGGVERKIRLIVEKLPEEVSLPGSACVTPDLKGEVRVLGNDGKEYKANVLKVGKNSLEVSVHGHTYEVTGVSVVNPDEIPREFELEITATDSKVVEIEDDVPVDSLVASGSGLKAEYSSGRWKIEGDLRRAGEYRLDFDGVIVRGCGISVEGTLMVEIEPDLENTVVEAEGEVYADEGGKISIDVKDGFGNSLEYESVILESSVSSLTVVDGRIPVGSKAGVYRKALVVLGGKEIEAKGEVNVTVMPGRISKASGFVAEGAAHEKIGKTPGDLWIPLKLVDGFGNDFSEFVEEAGCTVERSKNGVTVLKDGREFLKIKGVGDYSPDEGKVLVGSSDVTVVYRGEGVTFEVVEVPEMGVNLRVERFLGWMKVSVSGGECDLNLKGVFEGKVEGSEIISVPSSESLALSYSCHPRFKFPVIGDLKTTGEISVPPVLLDPHGISVISDLSLKEGSPVFVLASKDGEYTAAVVVRDGVEEIIVKNPEGVEIPVFRGKIGGLSWISSGQLVFSGKFENAYRLYYYDPKTGVMDELLGIPGKDVLNPETDLTGELLTFTVRGEGIRLSKVSGGALEVIWEGPSASEVAVSPDGKVVYSRGGAVYVWDGTERVIIEDDIKRTGFSWSPNGRWVVYYRETPKGTSLAAYDFHGGTETVLIGNVEELDVLWIGDDEFIFKDERGLAIYSLGTMRVIRRVSTSPESLDVEGNFSLFPREGKIHVVFKGRLGDEGGFFEGVLSGNEAVSKKQIG